MGITFLATDFGIVPTDTTDRHRTGLVARLRRDSIGFYLFQAFTALILILAANTSYNAFPRLAAILAQDDFMPRQFAFRGDRLAYTLGIAILAGLAMSLVVLFNADTHALIPLYSVGVFVSFTLSQGRHGAPLATGQRRPLETAPGDQRLRLRADRRGVGGRAGREGARRRCSSR